MARSSSLARASPLRSSPSQHAFNRANLLGNVGGARPPLEHDVPDVVRRDAHRRAVPMRKDSIRIRKADDEEENKEDQRSSAADQRPRPHPRVDSRGERAL